MTEPQKQTPAEAGVSCTGGDEARPTTSAYLHSADVYLDDKPGDAPKFAPKLHPRITAPWPPMLKACNFSTLIVQSLGSFNQLYIGTVLSVARNAQSLQEVCHNLAHQSGWWTRHDGSSITDNPYCFSNKLMLVVSELSEAMEGDRKGIKDEKLPHRDMREVELADAVIRIFDLAGAYNMDLGGAIAEKLHYNQQRADHKPENRAKAGGKAY